MRINVFSTKNEAVGQIDLDDSVFAAPVKPHLFYEVVKNQLASRRRGTAKVKTVSEVSGTGKKPYKQKGTGRARHGDLRAVQMRGGGVVHGPRPRDYSYSVPKKMVMGALRSALSLRNGEKALFVITGWTPKAPKTKDAAKVLASFKSTKALVVDSAANITLMKSLRNLPHVKFLAVEGLNVYDILNHDHLFVSDQVVPKIVERLKTKPSRKDREASAAGSAVSAETAPTVKPAKRSRAKAE
ncbi:MAG: 50S ribosomal protein L4 [Deltaproteobacteria bacterium]|nr:50S ribosomal protein L4 [Deltaproteobacteria bacterium]